MTNDAETLSKGRRNQAKIREMDIDDLATVFHLGEQLFQASEAPNLYRTWDEYEVVDLFQGESEHCLVAEADGELLGFALGTTISKTRSAWKYGHLVWLGVKPGAQRSGIAERLFNRFLEVMLDDNVRMLIVDTEADNHAALRFFRKQGFANPQAHTYLHMNLDAHRQSRRARSGAESNGGRNGKHDG